MSAVYRSSDTKRPGTALRHQRRYPLRIENSHSDDTILAELGRRIARQRLERNISQCELATRAGVARITVARVEAGQATNIVSFLRILRELQLLESLGRLLPEPGPSPIQLLALERQRRRRASGTRQRAPEPPPGPWAWGDEDDAA